jgi:aspartate-semialdehyde dehydrogenase
MADQISRPYQVGVLGATGIVGQRMVERLIGHPWFHARALGASGRSAGRTYGEAVRWSLAGDPPPEAGGLEIRPCRASDFSDCDLVFSALDASAAKDVEREFAEGGLPVVTNSSAHRMAPDVPILVPEINAAHLDLVESGRDSGGTGFIVANPNCSAAGLVVTLAPLHRTFRVRRVIVSTLQALSGAGTSGPRGLEMVDNIVPWIPGEEEKIERETGKMLGEPVGRTIREASIAVSAHCHRVGTVDGHLEAVSVELERAVAPDEAVRTLREFRGDVADLGLPSAPRRPIVVRDEADRPQPRRDRDEGGGMVVVVGRVRTCPVLTLRYELLSHNTVRGAAGAAILNAELLAARRLIPRRSSG